MSEGSSIFGARASRLLSVMVVCGGLALVVGAIAAPTRVWSNLLVASFYIVTLALGSLTFIAMTTVCGAGWNAAFRRVPEAMGRTLPLAGVAILAIVALGRPLYSWHADAHGSGTFWFKELWLDSNFLMIRAVVIVALWSLFSLLIVQLSRRQDNTPQPISLSINSFVSAAFLVVFAFTFSIASFDWLMALEPMWFSTMWGVYQFAGMMMATTSAVVVICLILRNRGPLKGVFTDEHLHDLGKLQVGFSCFWIYIWFSQYMLIWYTNIPEETTWFTLRLQGAWAPVVVANLLVNWIIPFFVLLPRSAKRSASVMMKIAVLVLIGRWIDLYQMVFPATIGDTPVFGGWEVAAIVCGLGLYALLASRAFASARPVPSHDPYMGESLHYHAG